ncbi:hypothetical protein GCM10011247_32790 [Pseudomonas plecoglossicida]|nr:hypothetical protein GCM10011247_32790 [Pseudomonas plecoglossicida]
MLGKPACFTLLDKQGLPHRYHGIVTEVMQLDSDAQFSYYRAVLEPRVALLRQYCFSEIWLDKSLADLIRLVLKEIGMVNEGSGRGGSPGAQYDFDIRLGSDDIVQRPVSFTCQFEETSFAFLSRLLEYYGVYYFFEQHDSHEALVLCAERRYQPQKPVAVGYRPVHSGLATDVKGAVAQTFNRQMVNRTQKVTLQDFSGAGAHLRLRASASVATAASASASAAFQGDYRLFGEHFGSNKEGEWLATRRAQAMGCRHREFHGSGQACGLRAGYPMQLSDHPQPAFNSLYQVIEVKHEGQQPLRGHAAVRHDTQGDFVFSTRFIALPDDVQFRSPCVTPRPYVQGVISAVVDGDGDSSRPLLDKHGRYKVSFPFIRGEAKATRGSAWLRLASPSSGSGHGMHFPLLKGTEVLVSFLGGDPDRPIIIGSVPNSENANMVNEGNSTQSGISTAGGHYLAMDDSSSAGLLKLGAPAGNSTLTLGHGDVCGARLNTDAHLQFSSSSHHQAVPGIYSLTIGVNGSVPSSELASSTWAGKNWGSFIPTLRADTVSTELKTAMVETEVSAGISKTQINGRLKTLDLNILGPKTTLVINPGTRSIELGHTRLIAAEEEIAVAKREENVALMETSVTRSMTAATLKISGAALVNISCGSHEITLTPAGIVIGSSSVLTLKSDVRVTGKLTVDGDVFCAANCAVAKKLKAGDSVGSPKVNAGTLNAGKTNLAQPMAPELMVGEEVVKASMVTKGTVQTAAGIASGVVHAAGVVAGEVAQAPRMAAVLLNPLL